MMPDIEKVIKGLEVCAHCESGFFCGDCPYEGTNERNCIEFLTEDALALLKEQQDNIYALETLLMKYGYEFNGYKKDYAEIVRCKDCKHSHEFYGSLHCRHIGGMRTEDWFCADGEIRKDELSKSD